MHCTPMTWLSKVAVLGMFLAFLAFSGVGCSPHESPLPAEAPGISQDVPEVLLTAPKMNNPSLDIVATNSRPLLSIFNAKGGSGKRTYIYQISADPSFPPESTLEYRDIQETMPYISEMKIAEKDALEDGRYHWRARAMDSKDNEGPWVSTRFFVDTKNTRSFMNLVRRPVQDVTVSSGQNPRNIIDWDDPGQVTYWNSSPPGPGGKTQSITFDLGTPVMVSRFWMLSNPDDVRGRLRRFTWQSKDSNDQWKDIPSGSVDGNDTFRNIVDIEPVEARFFRLRIEDYIGLQAQINTIIPYGRGTPAIPEAPGGDYVLLIGDQMNGFTYTMLGDFIKSLGLELETLLVPHREASLKMLESLDPQPVAIVVSGNNADYPNMPMFEYYGVFDIIRNTKIPLLGICAGHQFTSMAYGMTFARSMGWLDASTARMEAAPRHGPHPEWAELGIDSKTGEEPIRILADCVDLPIFNNMPNPFLAVEIHSWAVSPMALPEGHVVTAKSSYVQAVKARDRILYGAQFHGEAVVPYNQGGPYIKNFLRIALNARKEATH